MAILDPRKLLRQIDFQLGISCSNIWVCSQVITKEKCKLFAEAACSPNVNVRSALSRFFTEVPLRTIRVISAKHISKTLQWNTVGMDGLEFGHRDLDINDRFGSKLRNRCRSNVVNAKSNRSVGVAQRYCQLLKEVRPGSIIRDNPDRISCFH